MAILGMSRSEYDYYVGALREGMDLIGQEAILYQVDVEKKDLYRDPDLAYKKAARISLIFEDNPKPILKQMNWLTEDDDLAYVAYIVAITSDGDPIEVRENMKIRIPSKFGLTTNRVFLVSRVTGNHIDPVAWICKLVPYREKVDMIPETPEYDSERVPEDKDTSFSYLNV